MYVIVVLFITVFVFLSGLFTVKWSSPVSTPAIPINSAKEIAENIYSDVGVIKLWAEKNSISSHVVTDSDIAQLRSYSFSHLVDYKAVIVTDSVGNDYEIYSWGQLKNKNTLVDDVNAQLVNLTSQIRGAFGTSWSVPLVIKNSNCKSTILNGFLPPIKPNLNGYNAVFSELCNKAATMGAPISQNVLLVPIN